MNDRLPHYVDEAPFDVFEAEPKMSRNCFGCARRLRGQKRLPTPPAMMTA